jgi:hypothetical protein
MVAHIASMIPIVQRKLPRTSAWRNLSSSQGFLALFHDPQEFVNLLYNPFQPGYSFFKMGVMVSYLLALIQ